LPQNVRDPPAKARWGHELLDYLPGFEIEVPPAKARWCHELLDYLPSFEIEVPPAKARWRLSLTFAGPNAI